MDGDKFQSMIDNSHLWNDASDHTHWITRLVTSLLSSGGVTDEVLLLVTQVCEVKVNSEISNRMFVCTTLSYLKVEFCELVFPMLIYNILANQNAECTAVLTHQFTEFLKENVTITSGNVTMATKSSYITSLRTIIDTILFLRKINKPSERLAYLCMHIIIQVFM